MDQVAPQESPQETKKETVKVQIPEARAIDEWTIRNLIEDLVRQGVLDTAEADLAKKRMETIPPEQWEQIRALVKKNSREIASVRQEKDEKELSLKRAEQRKLFKLEDFDEANYRKLSREVDDVLQEKVK